MITTTIMVHHHHNHSNHHIINSNHHLSATSFPHNSTSVAQTQHHSQNHNHHHSHHHSGPTPPQAAQIFTAPQWLQDLFSFSRTIFFCDSWGNLLSERFWLGKKKVQTWWSEIWPIKRMLSVPDGKQSDHFLLFAISVLLHLCYGCFDGGSRKVVGTMCLLVMIWFCMQPHIMWWWFFF